MIDATLYKRKLDTIEKKFVDNTDENIVQSIKGLFTTATILGTGLARNEIKRLEHKGRKLMSEGVWQKVIHGIVDDEDIAAAKGSIDRAADFWDEYAIKIKDVYDQDKKDYISDVMRKAVNEGLTQKEIEEQVSIATGIWIPRRLAMIARTETTKCFNYGRIETFRENNKNGGIVKAVRFSAILDDRTTEICSRRHGLILDINDSRIDENTPPLHPNCRSILVPVDKWDYIKEYGGESSSKWEKVEKVDSTWGNPFAYGGKKPKTKIEPEEKTSLKNITTEDMKKLYDETFKDAPEEIKSVLNKYSEELSIRKGKDSYYVNGTKTVTLSKEGENQYTVSHEIGHYIDNMAHWDKNKNDVAYKFQTISYNEYHELNGIKSNFQKAMENALNEINGRSNKAKEFRKSIDEDMKKSFTREELNKREFSAIQDIINGLSKGKLRYIWGHKKEYWERKASPYHEVFANLFRINSHKGKIENDRMYDFAVKHIPEVVKAFEEFIKTGGE